MTRRELLALFGSSAIAKSLLAQQPSFGRIDVHAHIFRGFPALYDAMEKENWRALNICYWQEFDAKKQPGSDFDTVEQMFAAVSKVAHESRGRISWASTIDARGFEEPHFTEKTIATLKKTFKDGALGTKIWKTIGMKIRGKDGKFLLPDDKRLMPVYEAIQKENRTLIAHVAEPSGAWAPPGAPGAGYWNQNPQWRAEAAGPSKETILLARDQILAHFPKLRVIGAHMGSNEEDLKALAKRLDIYPNFCVDFAARVRNLFAVDTETARQFCEKYQDRLLYGSDHTIHADATDTDATDARAQRFLMTIDREWSMFASKEKISQKQQSIQGLGLPETTLRKIFYDNAVRMLPGIAPK